MNELKVKRIDFSSKEFIGKSGIVYRIEMEELSVGRYEMYERMALQLGFGVDFKSLFASFSNIYKLATSGDSTLSALHKITELCQGQMVKMKNSSQQKDEFLFCTLFMNTEDEDRSKWDMALAERKIEDWGEYDFRDFFLAARSSIEGYANALSHTEQLPPLPKEKKKNGKDPSQ